MDVQTTWHEVKNREDTLRKKIAKIEEQREEQRSMDRKRMAQLAVELRDKELWDAETKKIEARRRRVARTVVLGIREKQLKARKSARNKRAQMVNITTAIPKERIQPYIRAAKRLFAATGVDSMDKIVESFTQQVEKSKLMEKEVEVLEEAVCAKNSVACRRSSSFQQ